MRPGTETSSTVHATWMFRLPTVGSRGSTTEQRACGLNPTHQRRSSKAQGFGNASVEERRRFSSPRWRPAARGRPPGLEMKTRRRYHRKKHTAPLRRGGARDLYVLEIRPKIARAIQLVSTLNVLRPDEEFRASGPSRHRLEFRDQPNEVRESSAVIVGQEQVRNSSARSARASSRINRARVFPGFEGRFGFATVHVCYDFANPSLRPSMTGRHALGGRDRPVQVVPRDVGWRHV